MDDELLFADDRAVLRNALAVIERFAAERLFLTLKASATMLAPVTEGMPWLGFRVYPGLIRLDQSSKQRFAHNLRASMTQAAASALADESEISRCASLCGHVGHANTRNLRRSILDRPLA